MKKVTKLVAGMAMLACMSLAASCGGDNSNAAEKDVKNGMDPAKNAANTPANKAKNNGKD